MTMERGSVGSMGRQKKKYRTRSSPKKGITFVEVQHPPERDWSTIGYVERAPRSESTWAPDLGKEATQEVWFWHLFHEDEAELDEHGARLTVEDDEQYGKTDAIKALELAHESRRRKPRSRAKNNSDEPLL